MNDLYLFYANIIKITNNMLLLILGSKNDLIRWLENNMDYRRYFHNYLTENLFLFDLGISIGNSKLISRVK